jgi:hypothetical protein
MFIFDPERRAVRWRGRKIRPLAASTPSMSSLGGEMIRYRGRRCRGSVELSAELDIELVVASSSEIFSLFSSVEQIGSSRESGRTSSPSSPARCHCRRPRARPGCRRQHGDSHPPRWRQSRRTDRRCYQLLPRRSVRHQIEHSPRPVDTLVANAGGSSTPPGPLEEIPEEGWRAAGRRQPAGNLLTLKSSCLA